jgi:C-terminal processing protease CtpA/Prc
MTFSCLIFIIDSSIKSFGNNNFSLPNNNETMSQSLLEKFEDISCTEDRVLSQITVVKDPVFSDKFNFKSQSLRNLSSSNVDNFITGYTMGISIVQGQFDNYVYVKELVKNGPGHRMGICVGDQIVSVDGTSLINLPYEEALGILQSTGISVTLIVSQIFNRKPLKEKHDLTSDKIVAMDSPMKEVNNCNLITTPSKSLPNLLQSRNYQLPKVAKCLNNR